MGFNFLGEDKKSVAPRDYAVNRIHVGINVAKRPETTFLNQWIKLEGVKVTPANTAFGRPVLGTWWWFRYTELIRA